MEKKITTGSKGFFFFESGPSMRSMDMAFVVAMVCLCACVQVDKYQQKTKKRNQNKGKVKHYRERADLISFFRWKTPFI